MQRRRSRFTPAVVVLEQRLPLDGSLLGAPGDQFDDIIVEELNSVVCETFTDMAVTIATGTAVTVPTNPPLVPSAPAAD